MKRLIYLSIALFISFGATAQTIGIKVAAPIIKNSPSDNTVTGYANLLNGGYHTVTTIAGRDSLVSAYSKTLNTGMIAYVSGVDSTYRWNGSAWSNVSLSNYAQIQDGLVSGGDATIGTGSVTIAIANYRINKISYTSASRAFTGIANSPSGTQYYLVVYGKTSSTLDTISGVRANNAVVPSNPANTVRINTILIGDAGISSSMPDLSGYAKLNGGNVFNGLQVFRNNAKINSDGTNATLGFDLNSVGRGGVSVFSDRLNFYGVNDAGNNSFRYLDLIRATQHAKFYGTVEGSNPVIPQDFVTKSYGDATYNPTLVSGTNIKTVNSTSLLGSGDISVGTVTNVTSTTADATVANPTTTPAITIVSAPKLTNARTIGGTAFDGTANITPALATTVTTNANLTGIITSVGNTTSIADATLSIAKTSGLQTALDAKESLLTFNYGLTRSTNTITADTTSAMSLVSKSRLTTALNLKANDNAVVHLAGTETITGGKYFSAFSGNGFAGLTSFNNGGNINISTGSNRHIQLNTPSLSDWDISNANGISYSTANALTFFNGGTEKFKILPNGTANYITDVSSLYTTRSLIDKGYADATYGSASGLALKSNLAGGNTFSGVQNFTGDVQVPVIPANANSAASKNYIDNAITGITWKAAVRVATTANITLSGTQTIEGIALNVGDRVLVKNQTSGFDNGIYLVSSGTWTRSLDADTGAKIETATVAVTLGTVNANTQWTCVTTGITLGTTPIAFGQISGAGTYASGTGLTLTGNVFAIDGTVATLAGVQTLTNKSISGGQITSAVANATNLTGLTTTVATLNNQSGINSGDNSTNTTSNSYADAKVQNSLIASTTIAPSATAVNTGLASKQNSLTLTTTGTSGASTLTGATLNVPQYAGTTYTFSTGLINTSNTITSDTTVQRTVLNSYSKANADARFDKILTFGYGLTRTTNTIIGDTISTTGLVSKTRLIGALSSKESPLTFSSPLSRSVNTISIPVATTSVNGYLSSTDWNTFNGKGSGNGTVTSVAALTLGTTGTDLSSTVATGTTTPVITLQVPTASALNRGALSSTDWSTFNSKQAAGPYLTSNQTITLSGDVSGTGTTSIPSTVVALRGAPLTTLTVPGGLLRYTGTGGNSWVFDTNTYLTTSSAYSTFLPLTGGTLTGKLTLPSGNTSSSPLRIPSGVAPTTPIDGDIWRLTGRTQIYDVTQTKDVIFDKANSVLSGFGVGAVVTDNLGNLSVAPSADRVVSGVITKTSAYTVTLSDIGSNGNVLVRCDATGGAFTITLPTAVSTGLTFIIKKIDNSANGVTVYVASTIDGVSTKVFNAQYSGASIMSNGTNYNIVGTF